MTETQRNTVQAVYNGRRVFFQCNGFNSPIWIWVSTEEMVLMRLGKQSPGQLVVWSGTDLEQKCDFILNHCIESDKEKIFIFLKQAAGMHGAIRFRKEYGDVKV